MDLWIVAVLVSGLLGPCVVRSENTCGNLRLFIDETSEVLNFSCNGHGGSPSCRQGISTFPANLSDGDSVAPPRAFDTSQFRGIVPQATHITASGVNYTWKAPLDMNSRRSIKGFYLKMEKVGSGDVTCRLFDLQDFDFTTSTKIHFIFELFPFNNADTVLYVVKLFSLPPPSNEEYEEGLYERHVISLQPLHDSNKVPVVYPNDWTTWITLQLYGSESKVGVKFGYPDAESQATFEKFRIQLVDAKNPGNPLYEVEFDRGEGTDGRYNFSNVPTGTYRVQIFPVDRYFNDLQRCDCWTRESNYRACLPCTFTKTPDFNFTSTLTTTPTIQTTTTTTTKVSPSSADKHPSLPVGTTGTNDFPATGEQYHTPPTLGSGGIIGITVAALVVITGLILGGICLLKHRRPKHLLQHDQEGDGKDHNKNNVAKTNFSGIVDRFFPADITCQDQLPKPKVPEVREKTILLLAAEDHKSFSQAVEMFAQFLQLHCQCDVMYAPQQLPDLHKSANNYCWLSRQVDDSDFVVIVTSEAAHRLYLAFQKGLAYKEADFGPEGDLFLPGLQHICGKIANSEDVRKVMMVHFDHTSPDLRLPIAALPTRHYHLPNHLSSFLHHVHGLDGNRMDLSRVNLPLQGNVAELKGGEEWLKAVSQAKAFEIEHHDWFLQRFGEATEMLSLNRPKPDFSKQVSGDSGFENGFDSLRRQLSSISGTINAGAGGDHPVECINEGFQISKDDFIPPSELQSVYTVPYSTVMESSRPEEVDAGSTISDQLRGFNARYEQEHFEDQYQGLETIPHVEHQYQGLETIPHVEHQYQGLETIPQGGRPAVGGQLRFQNTDQHVYDNGLDMVHIDMVPQDGDMDCVSLASAQSV